MVGTNQENGPECHLQGCNEMDSCWEKEKRTSQNDMETISEKRNDRGWMDLEPDSAVVI